MDGNFGSFYGFKTPPFGHPIEPDQIFRAGSHAEVVDDVVTAVFMDREIIAVRGESGVGKTTLTRLLLSELAKNAQLTVRMVGPSASPIEVQTLLAKTAGHDGNVKLTPEQIARVFPARPGARLVLLFDDADRLSTAMFHYLGLLIEVFRHSGTKLHLVMLGKPGIWEGLAHPDLNALRQASASGDFILPLQGAEAEAYLDHKLRRAGQPLHRVMTKRAAAALCKQAHHLPARLDALAEQALQHGCRTGRKRIGMTGLRQALADDSDLEWPQDRLAGLRKPALAATLCGAALTGLAGVVIWHGAVLAPSPVVTAGKAVSAIELRSPGKLARAEIRLDRPAPVAPRAAVPATFGASTLSRSAAASAPPGAAGHPQSPGSGAPGEAPSARLAAQGMAPTTISTAQQDLALAGRLSASAVGAPVPAVATGQAPVRPPAGMTVSTTPNEAAPALPRHDDQVASLPAPAPQPAARDATVTPMKPAAEPIVPVLYGHGAPGLVFIARSGDNMKSLYARVYGHRTAPSYQVVAAANLLPVQPGSLVIFPEPPGGWTADP